MNNAKMRTASQALNLASDAIRLRQNLVMLGMAIVSLLALPDSITGWATFWIITAAILAAVTLTNVHLAHQIESPGESLPHIAVALGAGLLAVVTSMVVRPLSGMFLAVVLIVLSIAFGSRPFVTAALTVIAIPWWIWLAADAWHWQLAMLLPIVALGLLATSHILDTHAWPEEDTRTLSQRAHRAAAWMLIALTGIMIISVGLVMDMSGAWIALAGIVLAAAIPLEAGFGATTEGSAKPGLRIVSGAFLIAIACWLIGIA